MTCRKVRVITRQGCNRPFRCPELQGLGEQEGSVGSLVRAQASHQGLGRDTLENTIRSNLHGEAKDVASAMWADTKTFLNNLATWISEHYSQLFEQAGVKDGPEVWKLVCHCIRAIFKLMHEGRLTSRLG